MGNFVLPWGLDYCKCGSIKRQNIDKFCVDCKKVLLRKLKIEKIIKQTNEFKVDIIYRKKHKDDKPK